MSSPVHVAPMPHQTGSPEGMALGIVLIVGGVIGMFVHPIALFAIVLGLFVVGWSQRPS